MRTLKFALMVLPVFLTSCSSTNISNRDPFYDYVGKTVELKKEVLLTDRWGVWSTSAKGVLARRSVKYGLISNYEEGYGRIHARLPIGHQVRIESVWDEVIIDSQHIIAYGRTTIPPSTKEVSFAFPWGHIWVLERAPWEPASVPEKRAPPGKLPPHFDYPMFQPSDDLPKWGTKVKKIK